jgi:hypothetical protein
MRRWRRNTFFWNFFQGNIFQSSLDLLGVTRYDLLSVPLPSNLSDPRQLIPTLTLGFCFLGHPTPLSLRMVSCSSCLERVRGVPPFRGSIFFVTTGRYFTPGFFRVETTLCLTRWPETLPVWAVPLNQRGHVVLDDASTIPSLIVDHSHLLNEVTASGSRLIAFSSRFRRLIPVSRRGMMLSPLHLGDRS